LTVHRGPFQAYFEKSLNIYYILQILNKQFEEYIAIKSKIYFKI